MPSRFARLPRGKAIALAVGAIAVGIAVKLVVFPSARRLVAGDFAATAPVWSPTGKHLAFLIEDKVGGHVGVFSFEEGEHIVVGDTAATGAEAFSWSPDGTQLAYEGADADGTSGLRVYDVATREARPLAPASSPRWRADGSLVAVCGPEAAAAFDSDAEDAFEAAPRRDIEPRFCRIDPASGAIDLRVAGVGGGAPPRLSNPRAVEHRHAVSPDGKRIAYEVRPDAKMPSGASKSEIWVMAR
jgi:Tol biopolymer transport system component